MIVFDKEHLERVLPGVPDEAECFHCDELLGDGPFFVWYGCPPLMMHGRCFVSWMRRASRDLGRYEERGQ